MVSTSRTDACGGIGSSLFRSSNPLRVVSSHRGDMCSHVDNELDVEILMVLLYSRSFDLSSVAN